MLNMRLDTTLRTRRPRLVNPKSLAVCLAALCTAPLALPAAGHAHGSAHEGTLIERHGHRTDGSQTPSSYAVRKGGREVVLDRRQPERLIGQRVRVTDARPQQRGVQGTASAADQARLAAAPATGPRSLLVILLTTPEGPTAVATPDAARAAVFTDAASAGALFAAQSAGVTSLRGRVRADGDVTEPLAIQTQAGVCDFIDIANRADAAARAAGWAPEAYDHVLYAQPFTAACDWGGLGEMPGRRTWANGTLETRVVAHELGHNLGAHHANALSCADASGAASALSASCTSTEYADPFDVMGLTAQLMSSWHRAQLGQLPADQSASLRASQTVTLTSANAFAGGGPRLVLVPRKVAKQPVNSWLALELRTPLMPFDSFAAGSPVTSGVSIRVVPAMAVAAQSQLVDAHPATPGLDDAALQAGETLRDDAHGITISTEAVANDTIRATITMPPLVDDVAPTPPTNVFATGDTQGVRLAWSAATDDEAVDHYEIERDGAILASTPALEFTDDRVQSLTRAEYRVVAVDPSGNRGSSDPVALELPDATAPSAVPGLTATAAGESVTLTWSAAQDNRGVRSYRVTRNGAVLATVNRTSHSDRPGSGTHTYIVVAMDAAGNSGPATTTRVTVRRADGAGSNGPDRGGSDRGTDGPGGDRGRDRGGARTPRIVLASRSVRRVGGQRVVTLTFRARGARSMAAFSRSRRVAYATGSRLIVRVRVPRGGRAATLRITATSSAGTATVTRVVR